jgi:hypothetical protein
VSGAASVDKGTVVAVVLDAGGNELGRGTATASASRPEYGHYDVTVSFSGAVSGQRARSRCLASARETGRRQPITTSFRSGSPSAIEVRLPPVAATRPEPEPSTFVG